jgi:hypothetical protein
MVHGLYRPNRQQLQGDWLLTCLVLLVVSTLIDAHKENIMVEEEGKGVTSIMA